ncbi:hypothetical protein [Citrobacter braakii]|uniref:hypothetical protein n=1 Tax=Citrobacter braakii TaxID=57706 RepID=UPI00295CC21B|nr:hypothetical protein [Citrobacter braakii]
MTHAQSVDVVLLSKNIFLAEGVTSKIGRRSCAIPVALIDLESYNEIEEVIQDVSKLSHDQRIALIFNDDIVSRMLRDIPGIYIKSALSAWTYSNVIRNSTRVNFLLKKLLKIARMDMFTPTEREVIQSFKHCDNIASAAKSINMCLKTFYAHSISVAKKHNVKTTSHVHHYYSSNKGFGKFNCHTLE